MAVLNNNQVASFVNEAKAISTGAEAIDTADLQGIIDAGNDTSVIGSVEQFTKSLINVLIKNWYTDSSLRTNYVDPFLRTEAEFGAIIQNISIEVPEVQESHAWKDVTSGITTAGQYVLFLPVVHSQYYGRTISFELPICITGEQWKTAFHSASELSQFVSYVLMCVDNALTIHIENMSRMNRNNFMAEKIAYAGTPSAKGIHAINLVQEFVTEEGDASVGMTVDEFLKSPKALLFASKKFRLYSDYMSEPTVLYNTAQRTRWIPDDRKVVQVLSAFDEALRTTALSNVYHKDIVSLPNYRSVAFWQGAGEGMTFDEVSTIDVEIASDGTKVTKSGIVGFICDKYGILTCLKSKRVASTRFDPEDMTQFYYQYNTMLANDLTMSALVLYLESVDPVSA